VSIPTVYAGEAQLLSWSDTSVAGPKIVLALPDDTALECFKTLTMGRKAGQRFMVAVTLIGDDEQPERPPKPNSLVRSAGMVCKSDDFQRFVVGRTEEDFKTADEREEQAAQYVREWCGVASRRQIDQDHEAARRFGELMALYREFKGS